MRFSFSETSACFLLVCLISSLFATWPSIQPYQGNVLVADALKLGNLFSENPSTVQMTSANVYHNITYSSSRREFSIFFSGSYVLFNPNATFTTQLAMPFVSVYGIPFPRGDSFQVNVSNEPTPFIQMDGNFFFAETTAWIFGVDINIIQLLLFNATLEAHTETEITITLYGVFSAKNIDFVRFYYIVGSARAWSGTVTEIVQFITWDVLPTEYQPEENVTVTIGQQSHRKWGNYTWFYSNQRIREDSLWISYSIPRKADTDRTPSIAPIFVLFSLVLASIPKLRKR